MIVCVLVYWGCLIGAGVLYGLAAAGFAFASACAAALGAAMLMLEDDDV